MGREVSIMDDEFELSLELSIGGSYAKSYTQKKIEGKTGDPSEENNHEEINLSVSRPDLGAENGFGLVDLQKRREIQATRRQEARIKREEKLKKSSEMNNGGIFLEDKLILEAQQFRARVLERETRERDGVSEDSARKREKNGTKEDVGDLNISLFTENKNSGTDFTGRVEAWPIGINGFGYSCVVQKNEKNVFRAVAENGGRNSYVDCDSGNGAAEADGSLDLSSSTASDYQSMSQKGGSNSDTGSQSSCLPTHQNPGASRSDKVEHLQVNGSSLSPSTPQLHSSMSKSTENPKADTHSSNQTNHICSTTVDPTSPPLKETSGPGPVNKPPKPPNHNHEGTSIQHMPCVSTTGNGPNGKTITGFLYKYTASEVSIVCVCHGRSFSPAEFVEHAGGVDVSHPLRHITVVSPNLECHKGSSFC